MTIKTAGIMMFIMTIMITMMGNNNLSYLGSSCKVSFILETAGWVTAEKKAFAPKKSLINNNILDTSIIRPIIVAR